MNQTVVGQLPGMAGIIPQVHMRHRCEIVTLMRPDGRLLYMSRAAIPTSKSHGFSKARRQVCAYAFPRAALEAFAAHGAKMPLATDARPALINSYGSRYHTVFAIKIDHCIWVAVDMCKRLSGESTST